MRTTVVDEEDNDPWPPQLLSRKFTRESAKTGNFLSTKSSMKWKFLSHQYVESSKKNATKRSSSSGMCRLVQDWMSTELPRFYLLQAEIEDAHEENEFFMTIVGTSVIILALMGILTNILVLVLSFCHVTGDFGNFVANLAVVDINSTPEREQRERDTAII
ncbi:hypothetical protein NECAME_05005 [Necator americanus]|uniref:Uncharacterized protein n=1 Tax=Necator americanus TaxID=51031 RepID=W2SKI5_NECAM|nr:hypothetical protein NECAME_05005 [Necator americanus]ETN70184.1 hypothetical protein NECAME_05005 [Necator americanus]